MDGLEALTDLAFDTPLFPIGLVIGGLLFASSWLGLQLGRIQRRQRGGEDEKSVDILLGTLLALLGLMIAFTYAFALDRHSSRKAAVLLEANALGTAFLRADLLEETERRTLQKVLEAYAFTRFRLPGADRPVSTETNEAAIARSEAAKSALWPATIAGSATLPPPLAALLISSVNDVLDAHVIRVAALRDRVPSSVVLLSIAVACGALFTAAQAAGYRGDERFFLRALIYALTLTLVLTMILDFDRPSRGLIHVNFEPLMSTWEEMQASLSPG